jgi:hypothetical protein
MKRTAILSDCGMFRYRLGRQWNDDYLPMLFVMLNPSTADDEADDPTVRSCIGIAKSRCCGSIEVVNLFAYRATDPADLREAGYPVGAENDLHTMQAVREVHGRGGAVVVAWGLNGEGLARTQNVRAMLRGAGVHPLCMGTTASGQPRHPLYVRRSAQLLPFAV